jgi:hypothetical protein
MAFWYRRQRSMSTAVGLIALGFAKARGVGKCIGPVGDAPRASGGVRRRRALVWQGPSGASGETTNSPALIARVLGA